MFAKTIIDSDAFLDMPLSTQSLYFHLCMRADDEGFINNPKKIMRMIGCNDDDFKLLLAKSFVIVFETGVIVIKHWKIHNCIRKDRMKETVYQEERSLIDEKSNKAYTLDVSENGNNKPSKDNDNHMSTNSQPNDNQMTDECQPNDGLGEVSIGKVSIGKSRLGEDRVEGLPAPEKSKQTEAQKIVDLFNSIVVSLPKVTALTKTRKDNIKRRLRDFGADNIEMVFRKTEASDFLCGRVKTWQAGFDWVIKPENFVKIMEGNYDNKTEQPNQPKGTNNQFLKILSEMEDDDE